MAPSIFQLIWVCLTFTFETEAEKTLTVEWRYLSIYILNGLKTQESPIVGWLEWVVTGLGFYRWRQEKKERAVLEQGTAA